MHQCVISTPVHDETHDSYSIVLSLSNHESTVTQEDLRKLHRRFKKIDADGYNDDDHDDVIAMILSKAYLLYVCAGDGCLEQKERHVVSAGAVRDPGPRRQSTTRASTRAALTRSLD